ncbi:hypothetical protein ACMGD3_16560 [Lysinibacillus sphaericus]|uniref:hypothetical protein n=1 Tax=Lysinibacillus sphaericus TaxID=1421 RepID=UPI003F7AF098
MIDQLKSKKLIIFGAGSLAQRVINECEKKNLQIAYILDNNVSRHNTTFEGYIIKNPKSIILKENEIVLIASSYSIEIQKQLRELSLKAGIDYINYNILFPYASTDMKFSARFDELSDIGQLLTYSIDDVGVLMKEGNVVYRAIYSHKVEETKLILDLLQRNNFYNKNIIFTEISDKNTKNFPLILKHSFIPYCSDSRSWSFSMIKDGFITIYSLLKELRKENLTLKDSHGMNLTYYQGKFQWIDFGSFVKGNLEKYALKELVEWFVFPCVLMANGHSRAFYEHNNLGKIPYYMIQTFLDYEGKNILDVLYSETKTNENVYQLLERIKKWSDGYFNLKKLENQTNWEGYQDFSAEQQDFLNTKKWPLKQKVVLEFIKKCDKDTLLDIAGNNGWYCIAASKYLNMSGVLIDYDNKCIENAYEQFKKENVDFIPLVNDFKEFPGNILYLKQNLKFDVVLCLAFIHHLIFSNGFTFERIRDILYKVTNEYLIIEFIEPTDEYVSTWINPYFSWYNKQNFEDVFAEKYSLVSVESVSESRKVYLMKKV